MPSNRSSPRAGSVRTGSTSRVARPPLHARPAPAAAGSFVVEPSVDPYRQGPGSARTWANCGATVAIPVGWGRRQVAHTMTGSVATPLTIPKAPSTTRAHRDGRREGPVHRVLCQSAESMTANLNISQHVILCREACSPRKSRSPLMRDPERIQRSELTRNSAQTV